MPDNSSKFNPNLNVDIPKWVNEAYFYPILKNDLPNFVKILNFTTIPATPPGENYTSLMMRIKMDIEMEGKWRSEFWLFDEMTCGLADCLFGFLCCRL